MTNKKGLEMDWVGELSDASIPSFSLLLPSLSFHRRVHSLGRCETRYKQEYTNKQQLDEYKKELLSIHERGESTTITGQKGKKGGGGEDVKLQQVKYPLPHCLGSLLHCVDHSFQQQDNAWGFRAIHPLFSRGFLIFMQGLTCPLLVPSLKFQQTTTCSCHVEV
jgi:hypothetical protein